MNSIKTSPLRNLPNPPAFGFDVWKSPSLFWYRACRPETAMQTNAVLSDTESHISLSANPPCSYPARPCRRRRQLPKGSQGLAQLWFSMASIALCRDLAQEAKRKQDQIGFDDSLAARLLHHALRQSCVTRLHMLAPSTTASSLCEATHLPVNLFPSNVHHLDALHISIAVIQELLRKPKKSRLPA